jgi:hypothetical protein
VLRRSCAAIFFCRARRLTFRTPPPQTLTPAAQTYLTPAKAGVDHWNIITHGTRHYRPPPGCVPPRCPPRRAPAAAANALALTPSPPPLPPRAPRSSMPQPTIPTESRNRTYDIKYYTRDVRRNPDAEANRAHELYLPAAAQAALPREPVLEGQGSPGLKNPDALRYDPRGARNAMTTNWAALKAGLAAARPSHLPQPEWELPSADAAARRARVEKQGLVWLGIPKDARRKGWDYTLSAKYGHVSENL